MVTRWRKAASNSIKLILFEGKQYALNKVDRCMVYSQVMGFHIPYFIFFSFKNSF